jgi:alkylation response protein AidB-like acyl-CoA dehydrogenase
MRFAVAEEAAALRDASDALLSERVTTALIRSAWENGRDTAAVPGAAGGAGGSGGSSPRVDTVRDIWRGLAEIGLTGALVAAESAGLGLDENALPPVLNRIGYCGLPVPAVETVAVAAPLLAAAGHPALPDVLSGAALITANLDAAAEGGLPVPFLMVADYALLRVGDEVRLYERGEVDAEPVQTLDGSRQLARLRCSPAGGMTLATGPAAAAAWQRGVLGTAAVLVGLAERMLSMTVDYVAARRQFGVPVGSFQAVKHRLADAYVAVEFARPAVLAAGWSQAAAVADAAGQTSVAKVLASDAASVVARAAIQCHGAIGYTTEYDLHLFAKRAWALAASWGSAGWHRRRLAVSMGLLKEEGECGG